MALHALPAVCVDTRDPNLALFAAERMAEAGVSRVTLLTNDSGAEFIRPRNRYGIEIHLIPTLQSIDDYSRFMITRMADFIDAEHFLVFQWDGFILHPSLWWDGFLDYDFIGAPWPPGYANTRAPVGNGGFSLRSRRLLQALARLESVTLDMSEDIVIADNAEALSRIADIVIAPPEIARHFSIEHRPPDPFHSPWKLARQGTFGFHGWYNFHLKLGDDALLNYIDIEMSPAQRSRILKGIANTWLMVYLDTDNRPDCLREIAARTEAELGVTLDRSDPGYLQKVINLILTL